MIDAGESQVVQESPRESLFKDHYFVSGIGSGIAKRFKDPAQEIKSITIIQTDIKNKSL